MAQKLAVLDFDSTLYDGESLDEICAHFVPATEWAAHLGSHADSRTVRNNNSFLESLRSRVKLLRGISFSEIQKFSRRNQQRYHRGAAELVRGLQKRDYAVVIFSGGFRVVTGIAVHMLGIDDHFANDFCVDADGRLTGEIYGPMMSLESKGQLLRQLQNLMRIDARDTIAVGDSTNDISMFSFTSRSFAFCARPEIAAHATDVINTPDLSLILEQLPV